MNLRHTVTFFILSVLVINQLFSYPVFADEYIVSGNGEGSSNSISVSNNNSTQSEQKNEEEVKNEVEAESNTGSNETSGNLGETSIETGDSSVEIVVENSGNTNSLSGGCCPSGDSSAQITGNGSDSHNTINSNQSSTTQVSQINIAKITNNITINADTGNNEAKNNSGTVNIKTGEVRVKVGVTNKANSSYVSLPQESSGFDLKTSGNGERSENNINHYKQENKNYLVNNYLVLNNNINTYLNTGGNKAQGNQGDVLISTGSVYLDIILSNKGNVSKIISDCGCKNPFPTPTTKPTETPQPSSPPSGGECCSPASPPSGGDSGSPDGSSGGSDGTSSGGGQVLGVTLPETGGFSLIQATLLALSLLGSGIILRLDFKKTRHVKKIKRDIIFGYFYKSEEVVGKFINYSLPLQPPRNLSTCFTFLPPLLPPSGNSKFQITNYNS